METLNQNVLDEFTEFLIKNKYKNILKQLKLDHCTDDNNGTEHIRLVVIQIKDSQKEKGYGSAVMSEIVQLADKYNVQVHVMATNLFGADINRLYGFYKKHGFVLIKKNKFGHMIYYPKKLLQKKK